MFAIAHGNLELPDFSLVNFYLLKGSYRSTVDYPVDSLGFLDGSI
jgi:hypothetical protein